MKSIFFVLIATFYLLFVTPVEAQRPKNKFKKGGVIQLDDSLPNHSQSDILDFPNVNVVPFYKDEVGSNRIRQLQDNGDEKTAYRELREYVKKFGIENFSANTAMLLSLARLAEKHGPVKRADVTEHCDP